MNKLRFLKPVFFLLIVAGFTTVVLLLWNWLMPALFGLITINFWQALGILVLSKILFGGFGGKHGRMKHGKHHFREKWMKMTPEQRQEFVNKRREHFCRGDFFGGRNYDFEPDESESKNNE